jgi:hypothetical protein
MRHLTGAVWAKLKPRTDAFRLLGGTSDFLAGIVAVKGKTFVHSPFDFDLTSGELCVAKLFVARNGKRLGSNAVAGAIFELNLTRPNAEFRAYHLFGK